MQRTKNDEDVTADINSRNFVDGDPHAPATPSTVFVTEVPTFCDRSTS